MCFRVEQRRFEIVRRQKWIVIEDFGKRRSVREQVQDQGNGHAGASNGRLASKDLRVADDSVVCRGGLIGH
jgi:hypothetical protein